mmetsp:Transcript_93099/g.279299  ORF Transcript_93099/g.279299 Transcript_93099/m.279299 type:complete len:244 (+) Transcript_93099:487-1218(+)
MADSEASVGDNATAGSACFGGSAAARSTAATLPSPSSSINSGPASAPAASKQRTLCKSPSVAAETPSTATWNLARMFAQAYRSASQPREQRISRWAPASIRASTTLWSPERQASMSAVMPSSGRWAWSATPLRHSPSTAVQRSSGLLSATSALPSTEHAAQSCRNGAPRHQNPCDARLPVNSSTARRSRAAAAALRASDVPSSDVSHCSAAAFSCESHADTRSPASARLSWSKDCIASPKALA